MSVKCLEPRAAHQLLVGRIWDHPLLLSVTRVLIVAEAEPQNNTNLMRGLAKAMGHLLMSDVLSGAQRGKKHGSRFWLVVLVVFPRNLPREQNKQMGDVLKTWGLLGRLIQCLDTWTQQQRCPGVQLWLGLVCCKGMLLYGLFTQ